MVEAMPLRWTPSLSVGDAEIDEQHQELFRRAERLITALRAGDRSEVDPVLGYLVDYVASHFEAEERLMRELDYPDRDAHQAAHDLFRVQFREMVGDYRRKGATALVSLTIHNWLSAWLQEHVGAVDRKLGEWLRAHRA